MAVETAINISCLVGGPLTMWRLWQRRHALADEARPPVV
jgi:hypothetical protein